MKPFLTPQLIYQIRTLGHQQFTDDPKVTATITNPGDNTTFYITDYYPNKGMYFGYVTRDNGKGSWGHFDVDRIESLHELLQKRNHPNQAQHIEPTPISMLVPTIKPQIANARLARLVKRQEQERYQDNER